MWGVLPCGVPFHLGCHSVWGALPCGVPFHVGCQCVWEALPYGVPFHVGCHPAWGALPHGVPFWVRCPPSWGAVLCVGPSLVGCPPSWGATAFEGVTFGPQMRFWERPQTRFLFAVGVQRWARFSRPFSVRVAEGPEMRVGRRRPPERSARRARTCVRERCSAPPPPRPGGSKWGAGLGLAQVCSRDAAITRSLPSGLFPRVGGRSHATQDHGHAPLHRSCCGGGRRNRLPGLSAWQRGRRPGNGLGG